MSLGWVGYWGGLEGDYWVGFLLWGVGWFPFFCYWGVFSCVVLRLGIVLFVCLLAVVLECWLGCGLMDCSCAGECDGVYPCIRECTSV